MIRTPTQQRGRERKRGERGGRKRRGERGEGGRGDKERGGEREGEGFGFFVGGGEGGRGEGVLEEFEKGCWEGELEK